MNKLFSILIVSAKPPARVTTYIKPYKNVLQLTVLLTILSLCGCQRQPEIYQRSAFLMGTLVDIQVVCRDSALADKAISAAFSRIQAVELEMSSHIDASALSKVNKLSGNKQPVKVSAELFNLLQRGRQWGELSQGAFDISIGAVSRLWDFDNKKLPDREMLLAKLPLVNYQLLRLDQENKTAYLPEKGMALNLGGIAKGYAVDEAVRVLESMGIKRALVDAGGDMRALGGKTKGLPWKIGLRHPRDKKRIIAKISLRDKAVVTSGDYERFFIKDGLRYHHILNPGTGQPARELVSVTVLSLSAETADALSTAVYVMGAEEGLKLVSKQAGCEVLLVTSGGEIITSPGFAAELETKKIVLQRVPVQ